MRWCPMVLAAVVLGCGHRERECEDGVDNDDDGWEDCADQDCSSVCGEQCANFLDDDGNGKVDCADPACATACPTGPGGDEDCANGADDDGDWLVDCGDDDCDPQCDSDGDGWVDVGHGGDDCDDADFDVHPTAAEVPYDGKDQDCDPATPDDDVDGDGHLVADDCDDSDGATFPGAPETCGDAVINDCDWSGPDPSRTTCFGERPATTADATLLGASNDDWSGYAVATAGDLDNDGHVDLVVGSYGEGQDSTGAAYVVRGPITGALDLAAASVKWIGESEDDWTGFAVAGGADLTGDGLPDVAIGTPYDDETGHSGGCVYIVRGGGSGIMELGNGGAWSKIVSEDEYDQAGQALDVAGDVNGDGAADLVVGAPLNSLNANKSGLVDVVFGPIPNAEVELSASTYRIVGESTNDNTGCAVAGVGDLDGDGQDDIAFGVCLSDRGAPDGGAAFQFSTHLEADRLVSEADGAMVAQGGGDALGADLAGGDLNNDGFADIVVGAPGADGALGDEGAAYVAHGPATTDMNSPDARLLGEGAGDKAGQSVAVIDDLDGDGFREVVVGAPASDAAAEDAGAAYVVFGPLAGQISLADADVRVTGAGAFDFLGQSVAAAGDVDGDGWGDVVLGAPYHDGLAPSGGAVYLFTFGW